MPCSKILPLMLLFASATSAAAGPLADMAGDWRGAGWARETVAGPQETLRCQITNSYDAAADTLTLSGQCVVPGRRLRISGILSGSDGSERITGSWANPDGMGSAPVVGLQRDGLVAFNFNTVDPATGRRIAQNIELRVNQNSLRLRATDRETPDVMMSDISFAR